MSNDSLNNDVQQIRALIGRWAEAVRREDLAAIRADHGANILMFDVPPPFQSRGFDAYMATWQLFFANVESPSPLILRTLKLRQAPTLRLSRRKEVASTSTALAKRNRSSSA